MLGGGAARAVPGAGAHAGGHRGDLGAPQDGGHPQQLPALRHRAQPAGPAAQHLPLPQPARPRLPRPRARYATTAALSNTH